MSRSYEQTSSGSGKSNLTRNVLVLMIVAFVGGAILSGWVLSRYNPFESESENTAVEAAEKYRR